MTRPELVRLLQPLSLAGNHLVVHTALSSFGHVEGGARALCEALMEAVTEMGTVVMPAFTCRHTVIPASGVLPTKRATAFHSDLPVDHELGLLSEEFRRIPGVLRSNHPTHSFAAWGRQARDVLSTQRDNNPLGPLKKLNVVQGQLLLLGTTLQAASPVFLAEEGLGAPYLRRYTALRLNASGYEERVVVENVPGCTTAFAKLEDRLDLTKVKSMPLARGAARKIPIRYLVNLAARLLADDPAIFICEDPECSGCSGKREAAGGVPAAAVGGNR